MKNCFPAIARFARFGLAAPAILFAACFVAPATHAQETSDDRAESDPAYAVWRNQEGVQGCWRCHDEDSPEQRLSLSRLTEVKFWLDNDKHAIARRRVEPLTKDELIQEAIDLSNKLGGQPVPEDWFGASNLLSRRICDKLGYNIGETEGYQQFRDNCLTCHGGFRGESDAEDFALDQGAQPGISCNYCHQIDRQRDWLQQHGLAEGNDWRLKSPEEKTAAGMRDLVTVSTQASLCFDCHVGNRSTNQFVTHEMYAAGHPPLPSIELQTFCDQMPQHWQTTSDLHERVGSADWHDAYFTKNFPNVNRNTEIGDVYWNTRKMLIGALSARQQTLKLFVDSATSQQWADYALYDCTACHHELQSVSLRQLRGYPGPPGRPRQHEWPSALLDIAFDLTGRQNLETARQLESRLNVQFGRRPFGDPAEVSDVASELQGQVVQAIKQLETASFTKETAKQVLSSLVQTSPEKALTYDSARQLVWAMQTVAQEMKDQGDAIDSDVAEMIMQLGQEDAVGISSQLPAGRNQFIYVDGLAGDLRRRSQFDPEQFHEQLAEIAAKLNP